MNTEERGSTTALVLSAGGMFGAYQAGAWAAMWELGIRVDVVVGASIGSLNGWAIAGGCTGAALVERWMGLESNSRVDWRAPWPPWGGLVDPGRFEAQVREIHAAYRPRIQYGVVLTRISRMRPELFTNDITWRHLAASCAVPVLFPSYSIDGHAYTDGGFLNALPLWAAERMGARRVIAVDAWTPAKWMRMMLRPLRLRRRAVPRMGAGVEVVRIRPAGQLGAMRDALVWRKEYASDWIAQGRADAFRALAGQKTICS